MNRCSLLALVLPLGVLTGCKTTEVVTAEITYPRLVLSQSSMEFGTAGWGDAVERTLMVANEGCMPMGISDISLGDVGADNFTVAFARGDVECPAERPPECPALDGGGTDTAAAKAVDIDTGPTDTGGGGDDTGGEEPVDENVLFTLEPGCSMPLRVNFAPTDVGEVWGSVTVTASQATLPDDAAEDDLPDYLRDPTHWQQATYLHGTAEHAQGILVVRPRSYDFGFVHPDDPEPPQAYIEIQNVGDGDITLTNVALADTCDTVYTLVDAPVAGTVLEGGTSTVAQVQFDPIDDDGAFCELLITSDDASAPEVDVILSGNSGSDPTNHPPTVAIRSPENGYKYSTIRDLEMEINVFDVDQPATSLNCRVKSAVLLEATIADCAPGDESGHVFVSVPRENFDPGVDTIVVTVTDGSGVSVEASVSILVNTDFPVDDDDGDGWSSIGDEVWDCDDTNPFTYPEAAEVYDGADNDCDGLIDETTIGADDDGDSVSEIEGDCNDYDDSAYPGAPERGDGVDNDCDGVVDEGTSLSDDDGDGYAEVNGDCDDNDPDRNPAAVEECDGVDNDCDGLTDSADGCIGTDSAPVIVGGVRAVDANACESGDVVTLEAKVFDADGQIPTITWDDDSQETGLFDNPAAQVVRWTCPELPDSSGGKAYSLYVVAIDPDGQQASAFGKVAVYPKGFGLYESYEKTEIVDKEGCNTSGRSPAGGLAVAGLALAMAARRRK